MDNNTKETENMIHLSYIMDPIEYDKYMERLHRKYYPTKEERILRAKASLEYLEELEEEEKVEQKSKPKGKESFNETALNLILEKGIELWQSEGKAYMTIEVDGHFENHLIRSTKGRLYPGKVFYESVGKSLNKNALELVLSELEAKALFEGKEYPTYIRVGKDEDGYIFHDLCNKNWEVIRIGANGYWLDPNPPIKFVRTSGMLPLPYPDYPDNGLDHVEGETSKDRKKREIDAYKESVNDILSDLWQLLNLDDPDLDERSRLFVFGFLLSCFNYDGPFPIPLIGGEKGSAKSGMSRLLGQIIDPKVAQLKSLPTKPQDLFVLGLNNWILAFDNNSGIPADIADALCTISTGGGYGARGLYTDNEEKSYNVCRPQLINGIGTLTNRPDLLDRVLKIFLRRIDSKTRMRDSEIKERFNEIHPYLLTILYTFVSNGLDKKDEIAISRLPRMADFAFWVCSCVSDHPYTFFTQNDFIDQYKKSEKETWKELLENNKWCKAVIKYYEDNPLILEQFPGELFDDLIEAEDLNRRDLPDEYPKAEKHVISYIERNGDVFREAGNIDLVIGSKDGRRIIKINRLGKKHPT